MFGLFNKTTEMGQNEKKVCTWCKKKKTFIPIYREKDLKKMSAIRLIIII